ARLAALFELSESLLADHLASLVGSTQKVLVEGDSKAGSGRVTGRTERNEIVHIACEDGTPRAGDIAEVRIVRSFKHSLEGELTAQARRVSPAPTPARRRALPVVASDG